MKLVFIYQVLGRGCSSSAYKVGLPHEFTNSGNPEPMNTIKPGNDRFDEEVFGSDMPSLDSESVRELMQIFREQGDNPSKKHLRQVYDLVRNNSSIDRVPRSKYTEEVANIEKSLDPKLTLEKDGQKCGGRYFEVEDFNSIYLVHNYLNAGGCGCFDHSTPLAVFTNKYAAENFQKKCTNVYNSQYVRDKMEDGEYACRTTASIAELSLEN